jgi:ElaB/YqjD/DUF883 family membrane-anchored ribosome-binding protein
MSDPSSKAFRRAGAAAQETAAELEARLAALRTEMDDILKAIASKAEKQVSEATEALTGDAAENVLRELREAVGEIRRKTADAERKVVDTAREHPMQTILIAFGLGFLVSLMLRR